MGKFNSASAGNLELERVLNELSAVGNGLPATTGNIYYVIQSTAGNYNEFYDKYQKTYKDGTLAVHNTITSALSATVASRNDVVYVSSTYDENPTVDIDLNKIGVSLIGLGTGIRRPTITFGAEAAKVDMSAAGTRISNFRFDLGTVAANVTNAINITADGCKVDNCETVVHATSQFTNLLTATDAQFVKIFNNKFYSLHTAGATSGVVLDGCDDIEVVGNIIAGHFGEHALDNTTPASCDEILRAYIADNIIKNDSTTGGDLVVELDDDATGVFVRNMLSGGQATIAANFDIGNMSCLESYIVDDAGVDVHGIPLGTAAA
jgi:hypothetical protein